MPSPATALKLGLDFRDFDAGLRRVLDQTVGVTDKMGGGFNLASVAAESLGSSVMGMAAKYTAAAATVETARREFLRFAEVDQQMRLLGVRAHQTFATVAQAMPMLRRLAGEVGRPLAEILDGFETLRSTMHLSWQDAERFYPDVARAAFAANVPLDQMAKSIAATMYNLKIARYEARSTLDQMYSAAADLDFNLGAVADQIPRITQFMSEFGITGPKAVAPMIARLSILKDAFGDEQAAGEALIGLFRQLGSPQLAAALGRTPEGMRRQIRIWQRENKDVFAELGKLLKHEVDAHDLDLQRLGRYEKQAWEAIIGHYDELERRTNRATTASGKLAEHTKAMGIGPMAAVRDLTGALYDLGITIGAALDVAGVTDFVLALSGIVNIVQAMTHGFVILGRAILGDFKALKDVPDVWGAAAEGLKKITMAAEGRGKQYLKDRIELERQKDAQKDITDKAQAEAAAKEKAAKATEQKAKAQEVPTGPVQYGPAPPAGNVWGDQAFNPLARVDPMFNMLDWLQNKYQGIQPPPQRTYLTPQQETTGSLGDIASTGEDSVRTEEAILAKENEMSKTLDDLLEAFYKAFPGTRPGGAAGVGGGGGGGGLAGGANVPGVGWVPGAFPGGGGAAGNAPGEAGRGGPSGINIQGGQPTGTGYYMPGTSNRVGGGLGGYSASMGPGKHGGDDIMMPHGSPVHAVKEGIISRYGRDNFGGLTMTVRHPDGSETTYMHLSRRIAPEGSPVAGGQVIGLSGTANGVPHLHLEMKNPQGQRISPRHALNFYGNAPTQVAGGYGAGSTGQPAYGGAEAARLAGAQHGIGSWYQPGVGYKGGGPQTATGAAYSSTAFAAAVPQSQRGLYGGVKYGSGGGAALVEDPVTGKAAIVNINDVMGKQMEGSGRVIDLARGPAGYFGMLKRGLARLRVTPILGWSGGFGPISTAQAAALKGGATPGGGATFAERFNAIGAAAAPGAIPPPKPYDESSWSQYSGAWPGLGGKYHGGHGSDTPEQDILPNLVAQGQAADAAAARKQLEAEGLDFSKMGAINRPPQGINDTESTHTVKIKYQRDPGEYQFRRASYEREVNTALRESRWNGPSDIEIA